MNNLITKILKIDETFTKPIKKPKIFNKVKNNIPVIPNYNMMADLLFLPTTSKGFSYLLVVVDLATDAFDIEPIKNKEPSTVLDAIKIIFKRKFIKQPYASIRTDNGNEFKGVFHKYLYNNSILHKMAIPYRHKQLANVERLNKELGRIFNGYMNNIEIKTKKTFKDWDSIVDTVRTELNKIRKINIIKDVSKNKYPVFKPRSEPKYDIGDNVYYKLEYPENALGKKQNTANFRVGNIRWHMFPKAIKSIIYMGDEPYYRYILEGIPDGSYSEDELKKHNEKETKFTVKEIFGKKKEKEKDKLI